jgi:hypothetical protein
MIRHRVLVGLGVLFVSLGLMSTQTQAKVQTTFDSGHYKGTKGVVFMNQEELLRMAKSSGLKVHMVKFIKLSKHELEKLAKLSSSGCGCAAPVEDTDATGWSCVKGCLSTWGVPDTMIWACAASCGMGLPQCIGCLGVAEYIVAGCAMYCAWAPLYSDNRPATPLRHNLRVPTRSTQQAKLSPRAADVASLR